MIDLPQYIDGPNGKIAYKYQENGALTMVWLCGFHSDMEGSKAQKMVDIAKQYGASSLLFDYTGHGQSAGEFENCVFSQWLEDAKFIIEQICKHDLILIGSSMGGWIALKLAMEMQSRVKGIQLIAPAPDFTEDLMWNIFSPQIREQILNQGYWLRPSEYDPIGYKITRELIEDGRKNLILDSQINLNMPIQILHGMNDEDVPFMRSIILAQKIKGENIRINFVKDGNHRLSRDSDLDLLGQEIAALFLKV